MTQFTAEVKALRSLHSKKAETLKSDYSNQIKAMASQHKERVKTLESRNSKKIKSITDQLNDEINGLRGQVELQREKILALYQQAKHSQKLLSTWDGLQEKIQASLPRKHNASPTGQQVVEELETTLGFLQDRLRELIASIPSKWPIKGRITSRVGTRPSPWTGAREFHSGTDIVNRWGTPVYAPADGLVRFAGYANGNGKNIILDHGQGITTHYAHLSKFHVKKGDRVRKDQKIANMGNTGRSTNPHLHYEIRVEGVPIDPRRHLLKEAPPSS
jgi:murein DD-endopeptidase MepM/ murein hydrolase activator NlpD